MGEEAIAGHNAKGENNGLWVHNSYRIAKKTESIQSHSGGRPVAKYLEQILPKGRGKGTVRLKITRISLISVKL